MVRALQPGIPINIRCANRRITTRLENDDRPKPLEACLRALLGSAGGAGNCC